VKSAFSIMVLMVLLAVFPADTAAQLTSEPLPDETSSLFAGSGVCAQCHESDGNALTENGVDVSPVTHWRSTMMGNAAKDPLWRAKVSSEIAQFPQFQEAIESKCTKCHAPMAYTQAIHDGADGYSIAELEADPLARDGVSCTLCHQIQPDNFGEPDSYTGGFIIDESRMIYGPYEDPLVGPMRNMTNFTPAFGAHLAESELCATCHTLFTSYVNDEGELEGSFPEQTPYIEWKNSEYPQEGKTCQSCHMPETTTPIDIATMPPWHQIERTPYWYHHFVGGNVFMLGILKNNIDLLGLSASEADFDSTIARTQRLLENDTVGLTAEHAMVGDTLQVDVRLENLTGHKLPTGIPFRRIWVHLEVVDTGGTTVFESGNWDATGEVLGIDDGYEPHHDQINDPLQVPIYEGIMHDVNGSLTYTLLRASGYIKDNRLPPLGFTTSHSSYDTVSIAGLAESDLDFNRVDGGEGSGADIIHYRIPVIGGGDYTVDVEVCYQTFSPRAASHLLTFDTPEVELFSGMYDDAEKAPVILAAINFVVGSATAVEPADPEFGDLRLYQLHQNHPNPFNPTTLIEFNLAEAAAARLVVFDINGRTVRTLVSDVRAAGHHAVRWDGRDSDGVPVASGVYFYRLETSGYEQTRRMVLLR